MVKTPLGTPPVCKPARILTAGGRSCSERDRVELAHRLGTMMAQIQPVSGAQDWLQVVRSAESAELSRRGAGSAAFRHKAAKAIRTDGARCHAGSAQRGSSRLEQVRASARGGGLSGGEPDLQRSHCLFKQGSLQ